MLKKYVTSSLHHSFSYILPSPRYEEEAKQAGVTLVNLCGFDSVPSDSTIHLANKTLKAGAKAAGRPGDIHTSISCYEGTGGFSPGTMESIYAMFDRKYYSFSCSRWS